MPLQKTIMLIDDDEDEAFFFNDALVKMDELFELVHEEGVSMALEALESLNPDYIFIDMNMPQINGLEGISLIKQQLASKSVPMFLYSGGINENLCKQARLLGANGCIKKAETADALTSSLKKYLQA